MSIMRVVTSVQEMANISDKERANGKLIRLVPTMGALHRGHVFLIKNANEVIGQTNNGDTNTERRGIVIIVSIFVNPLQFNSSEDFSNYPNTMQSDLSLCRELGVNYVFAPRSDDMYPNLGGVEGCMVCPANHLANTLEGQSRPGHFTGMLTVVCKLFNIIRCHEAYFGEKDYQQLLLVTKMSEDLSMGVQIVPVETVREDDMLPLSSRNFRLNHTQRQMAPVIYRILVDAKQAVENHMMRHSADSGEMAVSLDPILAASMIVTLGFVQEHDATSQVRVDYLQLRCSRDLSEVRYNFKLGGYDCNRECVMQQVRNGKGKEFRARLLTSVIVANIRLLDNIEVLLNT